MKRISRFLIAAILLATSAARPGVAANLSDADVENIVRRSLQYIAMYNISANFAMSEKNPVSAGGWNKIYMPTGTVDHTATAPRRPSNDTLNVISVLDMRDDPVVIKFPAFDSKFVSLVTSAYDHYVNVPLSTTRGDFKKPVTLLFYTARTKDYSGEPVEGVDKIFKMTGDFAIASLRVAPHANEPERMARNLAAMTTQKLMTLSRFRGQAPKPVSEVKFPAFGTDQKTFASNFLEVMQFVLNHTSFDASDNMDQKLLAALKPLGVEPGKSYDPEQVAKIDGDRFAGVAAKVARESQDIWNDPEGKRFLSQMFMPKGRMTLEPMVVQSAAGPFGQPANQAIYRALGTSDGKSVNAQNDYVIRMNKDQLPPANAFWSVTLYDANKGLFIANDQKKYTVGESAGMKLDKAGGIEIHIAAKQPKDVPNENWLPIIRRDENLQIVMRIYAPDQERMKSWAAPKAALVPPGAAISELINFDRIKGRWTGFGWLIKTLGERERARCTVLVRTADDPNKGSLDLKCTTEQYELDAKAFNIAFIGKKATGKWLLRNFALYGTIGGRIAKNRFSLNLKPTTSGYTSYGARVSAIFKGKCRVSMAIPIFSPLEIKKFTLNLRRC